MKPICFHSRHRSSCYGLDCHIHLNDRCNAALPQHISSLNGLLSTRTATSFFPDIEKQQPDRISHEVQYLNVNWHVFVSIITLATIQNHACVPMGLVTKALQNVYMGFGSRVNTDYSVSTGTCLSGGMCFAEDMCPLQLCKVVTYNSTLSCQVW